MSVKRAKFDISAVEKGAKMAYKQDSSLDRKVVESALIKNKSYDFDGYAVRIVMKLSTRKPLL